MSLFALTRRHFLQASTAGIGAAMLHPFAARASAGQAHLRIMEPTDLHVHVWPYDYYADKPVDTVGAARTAALIRAVRDEAGNSVLLDNGDILQGNPMGDYVAYERGMKPDEMHPIITA
ncbi:MAG: twin-arginine translocation signal domain-containing protein, partial [Paracoccus sp. (in: a-proteobacteria)]